MRRTALYSSARPVATPAPAVEDSPSAAPSPPRPPRIPSRWRTPLLVLSGVLAVLAGMLIQRYTVTPPVTITQGDIDRAVLRTLEKKPLPSKAAKAYEVIRPSIVRVVGLDHPEEVAEDAKPAKAGKKPVPRSGEKDKQEEGGNSSIGTGVVITEQGAILTNLHVVSGTSRILVVYADGTESEAVVTGIDAKNDLAVLRTQKVPDDLKPATLVSTGDLKPGDEVVAAGFPFGFGPSVSSGVVSGLKREFRAPDGKRVLSNLIQFDAAANPGNSGGPLINMEGEVVGIVTAILNPVQQRFFVGLGFAVPIENAASAVGFPPF